MAKRLTVAQLTAELEASHVAYQALLAKYEALKSAPAQRGNRRTVPARPAAEPSAFKLACQRAREQAMRSGKSVLVG